MTTDVSDSAKRQNNLNIATLRTLKVLSAFANGPGALGVTEVSRALRMSKNMAYRTLKTLEHEGYLVRAASGKRYMLGPGVLWLRGQAAEEPFDIRDLCRPYLHKLHDATGESVFLSVILGRNHVTIDSVEAHGTRVSHNPRGLLVPLHASPASRVLLAHLSDAEIEDYLKAACPLQRFTESTITDAKALWDEVRLVRGNGYARGYGDHYANATYISFPVLDATGHPHAAITIGAPKDRMSEADVDRLLPRILAIIGELNRQSSLYHADAHIEFKAAVA